MPQKEKIVYLGNRLSRNPRVTPATIDTLSQNFIREGFEVIAVSNKQNKALRLLHMILTVVKHHCSAKIVLVDTYSTQNFWYAVAVAGLCRWYKIPYIPILHGGNLPNRLQKSPAQSKRLFSRAKTNVAPSRYLMDSFKQAGFSNTTFIPNAIELQNYPFTQRNTVLPKLLWVRSFAEIYNPLLALKIVERLQDIFPQVQLCMVGPDKDGSMQACKSYAQSKSLPVVFTGKLDKKDWIVLSQQYDIFINTTNFDNTPVSVMEAMALGLPIITTNVGGIPFLLQHKKEALCVPPNDVEAFVEALIMLHQTPGMARSLTLNARKNVENCDWQKVKELWIPLLQD